MADPATEATRRRVLAFADALYTRGQVEQAFAHHVAEDYRQHNPGLPDGRPAAVARLSELFAQPGRSYAVLRILADGDLAAVHVRMTLDGRDWALADLYRVADGLIVEHWDVIQQVPESPVSTHPMF